MTWAPLHVATSLTWQVMPDVPLSLIREEFEHVPPTFNVEDAAARRGNGLGHPGHDCWAFPREWVPRLLISFTMVGVSMVATDLMQVGSSLPAMLPACYLIVPCLLPACYLPVTPDAGGLSPLRPVTARHTLLLSCRRSTPNRSAE